MRVWDSLGQSGSGWEWLGGARAGCAQGTAVQQVEVALLYDL